MPQPPESFHCDACDRNVSRAEATRTETFGDLDPEKWQAFCCPGCGRKLKTVFVGLED
jgi:transcription initiation factor IIE alpha subunit